MRLTLARDVTLTDVETGAVLLDGRKGRYWQLNASGSAVLRRLLDGADPATVAAGLAGGPGMDDDRARQDVQALVEALSASALVEVER